MTAVSAVLCALPQALAATVVGDFWPAPAGMAPALGLAVALSAVWGRRALGGILAGLVGGAVLARAGTAATVPLGETLAWAAAAGAGVLLAGHGLRRSSRPLLSSVQAASDLILWGALVGAAPLAIIAALLAPSGSREAAVLILEGSRMATGVLVFTPLGLAILQALPEHGTLPRTKVALFFTLGGLLLIAAFSALPGETRAAGLLAGLVLPLLLWGGLRLPPATVVCGNAAAAVAAASAAAAGAGPFRFLDDDRMSTVLQSVWGLPATAAADLPGVFAYAAIASLISVLAIGAGQELAKARLGMAAARTSLRSGLTRLRDLLDTAPVAATVLRRDGTLVYANQRSAEALGCAGRDMAGADIARFMADPRDLAEMLARLDRDGQVDHYEYRLRPSTGALRWVEENWAPMTVDAQPLILAWSTDVTERKKAEDQLRASERRLRTILDESPAAVVISRPGGRILFANPRAAGLVGLPRALLIGADGRDFYANDGQCERLRAVMRSGGAVVNEEVELRAASGQHRTCVFSLLPMEFDGAPARLAWSFDITFRKRAEEQLRKSEARLRSILEASPLAMAAIDRWGRLRYANSALLDKFALEEHEAIGFPAGRLVATPLEARALRHKLLKERQIRRGVEAELRRLDGSTFWGLLSFEPAVFEGEAVLFAWAADITERKQAERALTAHRDRLERAVELSGQAQAALNQQLSRELEERKRIEARIRRNQSYLRTVLDTVADGIIAIDSHGLIEDFNPAAERIFGYGRSDVLGRNVSLLMPEPDRSHHDDYIRRYLRGDGQGFVGHGREVTGLRADGTRFPLYLAISAAQVGERTVFTGVLRDITEQKQAEAVMLEAKEAAELANRAKSEFLANMSHELRTPLNAIIGFSEMIKSEILGPVGSATYLEYVNDIHGSGRHLLDVINDILDIARIEAGRMTLHQEPVDVAACAAACLKLVQPRAQQTGLRLEVDIGDDLPHLHGDPRRIKQMLLNLLSNAVKFTPEGGRVGLAIAVDEAGMRITVSDTGPGMTLLEARDALKPFVQVDAGLSRRYEGTGLGLPLVAAMAEMHGGSLTLASARGAGTRASILFPPDRILAEPAPGRSDGTVGCLSS
jgi:PAS domain S-box-containing protein